MYDKLNELGAILMEAMRQVQNQGTEALKEALNELFEVHPEIKQVQWTQYTPYFNDGSPCEFGVNEPSISFVNGVICREHIKEERCIFKQGYRSSGEYEVVRPHTDKELEELFWDDYDLDDNSSLKGMLRSFSGSLGGITEALQHILGDHILVTCTRDGIECTDYEHD